MTTLLDIIEETDASDLAPQQSRQICRPYQSAAVEAVLDVIDPFAETVYWKVMYSLPTAAGKTTTFAEIIRRLIGVRPDARFMVVADRKELIKQAYKRIKNHCNLFDWEVGMEIAQTRASATCRVIVGSVQTCRNPKRPTPPWRPDYIIVDECDLAAATSYKLIADRYGVTNGRCVYIGCTATYFRHDKQLIFAEWPDGTPATIERKKGVKEPATHDDAVFQRMVYDYPPEDAMQDGWIISPVVFTLETDTSLDDVKTHGGEFEAGDLEKRVNNAKRTNLVINGWQTKKDNRGVPLCNRPTLMFTAGTQHAHDSARLFREAGYTAEAIDCETDSWARDDAFRRFESRELRVICNYGIATRGTDLPVCACIIGARPTKSEPLFRQYVGRGFRALDGLLDGMEEATAEERLAKIAASEKPDCAFVDVQDQYKKMDVCSAPNILGIPLKLNMEGHSLLEAKRMLDEFKDVKDRVIGECPVTYHELEVKLRQVSAMLHSGASTADEWKATNNGYRYSKVPPGFSAEIERAGDTFVLKVKQGEHEILNREGRAGHDMQKYLDKAAEKSVEAIEKFKADGVRMPFGKYGPKHADGAWLTKDVPTSYLTYMVNWAKESGLEYKLKGFNVIKNEYNRRKETAG